ncbi:hypothetical protein EJ03DRAFT_329829 [Teratosphaeria nubilosa]|uniref:DUF3405 domain-containing protein n=1 Tax=Teratosphaeria nubilosa TaxID=161662 RepID=A0A6G1L2M1_9PEZI|nr:hypothetical protein EJ03DRAFT_329829 [Teratosphaeria nubilosa]
MLLTGYPPRRLVLVVVLIFLAAVLFLQQTTYKEYMPAFKWTQDGQHGSPAQDGSRLEKPEEGSAVPVKTAEVDLPVNTADRPGSMSTVSSAGHVAASSTSASYLTEETMWTISPLQSTTDVPAQNAEPASSKQPLPHEGYETVQSRVQELIKDWTPPPQGDHWPPYDGYADKDYDPNRWEAFEWDTDFYLKSGIGKLEQIGVKPKSYRPYLLKEGTAGIWRKICEGPRGLPLNESNTDDVVKAYAAIRDGFPDVAIGTGIGIDLDYCFDRYNRYGPYGLGEGEEIVTHNWEEPSIKPNWSDVRWGYLQDQCVAENKHRFADSSPVNLAPGKDLPEDDAATKSEPGSTESKHSPRSPPVTPVTTAQMVKAATPRPKLPRTAILIRTWEGYDYTENDKQAIRALVTELNLLSGGEYQVFLFVNIKDSEADIWNTSSPKYAELLHSNVPHEFWDISVLWNEKVCQEWYPKIGDWQVYWHQWMPVQWFGMTHPEFDFVWNWETDARYTGSHYQFFESVANFSDHMPRRYLWERSSRFYFPSAHGSYEQWLADTDATIERGINEGTVKPVWGPADVPNATIKATGPAPTSQMELDKFEWGVGEPADLITLQPIWDPAHTIWTMRDKIWNYIDGLAPHFTGEDPLDEDFHPPEYEGLPRRAYINTVSRFSKRQLKAMHMENLEGRAMQAEMWPATVALHHGLKAVYAPHPIWTDRKWPAWYMDAIFNADGNKTAQWGQQADSVYDHDREHNFNGWSWYYHSEFPRSLYRRWLGWSADDASPLNGISGKSLEEGGAFVQLDGKHSEAVEVGGGGRMCLPPMLLHPVKKVKE